MKPHNLFFLHTAAEQSAENEQRCLIKSHFSINQKRDSITLLLDRTVDWTLECTKAVHRFRMVTSNLKFSHRIDNVFVRTNRQPNRQMNQENHFFLHTAAEPSSENEKKNLIESHFSVNQKRASIALLSDRTVEWAVECTNAVIGFRTLLQWLQLGKSNWLQFTRSSRLEWPDRGVDRIFRSVVSSDHSISGRWSEQTTRFFVSGQSWPPKFNQSNRGRDCKRVGAEVNSTNYYFCLKVCRKKA